LTRSAPCKLLKRHFSQVFDLHIFARCHSLDLSDLI
jgi:hypothetical protein